MYNFAHLKEKIFLGNGYLGYQYHQMQLPLSINFNLGSSFQIRTGVVPTYYIKAATYSNQTETWLTYRKTDALNYNRLNIGFQIGAKNFLGKQKKLFLDYAVHYNPFSLFTTNDATFKKYEYKVNQLLFGVGYRF